MPKNWEQLLLDWFKTHQREMPWRSEPKPYYVWVSEIMLQQTQVITVIPYFNRFIEAFPSVDELAKADLQEVLKLWEGLGYYSRARNLHKAAKLLVSEFNSTLPSTFKEIQKIPGIGPYCAAAITSIAYENPVPVVDGNVLRVFTRFWGIEEDIRQAKVRDMLFDRLMPHIQSVQPSQFNQAIMELGALLCVPQRPKCMLCPLQKSCHAFLHKQTDLLPIKSKKNATPHHHIAVGIIWKDNQILIAKRQESKMLGGLWEFPGGKQEAGESLEETVIREIKEETDLNVTLKTKLCEVKHTYTHFKITLHAFLADYVSGQAQPKCSDEVKWIGLDALNEYPFPTANKKVLENLMHQVY